MNKLSLPGSVWVASDIHLGPDLPATQQAFIAFIQRAAIQADALILCGDIFEAWIGDDLAIKHPPDWLTAITDALRQTSRRIPVFLGRGNRDFLLGHDFANHVGAQLLDDQTLLQTDAGTLIISHGDEYCTDDAAYQNLRRWVRKPWVQKLFLGLSLATRQRIAAWARARSRRSTASKQMTLLDVNQNTILQAFEKTGVHTMVHGHTHRPAVHHYQTGTHSCVRYVLPDWHYDPPGPARGGWLVIDAQGIRRDQASKLSVN